MIEVEERGQKGECAKGKCRYMICSEMQCILMCCSLNVLGSLRTCCSSLGIYMRNTRALCQCVICRVCDTSSVNKLSRSHVAVTVLILGTWPTTPTTESKKST